MEGKITSKITWAIFGLTFLTISGCALQFEVKNPLQVKRERHVERGLASWYGPGYYGNKTASGETYTGKEMTAAHRTLPFDTHVKVTRLDNNKSIIVRINDRGPFRKGYIIDLSEAAARKIGLKKSTKVELRVIK